MSEKTLKDIPVDRIIPGKNQPRDLLGDLSELAESIKEKGIIEPIIVRKSGEKYEIISGERRYRAALMAGLTHVPCIELEVDDREAMELALIENIHRKDLTTFEVAEAYRALIALYGYTHEELAKRVGKARSTVTEMIEIANMPPKIKNLCMELGITAYSMLLLIAKQKDEKTMEELARRIAAEGLSRDEARKLARKGKPRVKTFKFSSEDEGFHIRIRLKKEMDREKIIEILQQIINKLRKGEISL